LSTFGARYSINDMLAAWHACRRFLPPIVWMAVIATSSGDVLGAEETGSRLLPILAALFPWASPPTLHALHLALRKFGHLFEYGVLALLWRRAFAEGRWVPRAGPWAIGLAAVYAVVDEARQGLALTRTPSAADVILDAAGAFLAVAWLEAPGWLASAGARALRAAAVLVLAGTLAAAVVDWRLGLAVWDLLLAALGAAALVVALGRLAARWRGPA
jgi:VanZ family protein